MTKPRAITKLVQTSHACPSQWDAETDDGRPVYIRYRWGYLSVRVAPAGGDPVAGERVVGAQLGDELDGMLDIDGLRAALSNEGIVLR